METPKQQFSKRVNVFLGGTATPSPTVSVTKSPIHTLGFCPRRTPEMGVDRLRRLSWPTAGLKPFAGGMRKIMPFGSPKRDGQHDQTRRNTGGDARSQVDPSHGGTDARVHRRGRLRDQMPPRLRGHMDGPASPGIVPPVAALREARLNGFPEALAQVRRHHIGGGGHRVLDPVPKGWSDAAKTGQPAYPVSYTGAGEGWPPPPLRSPHESRSRGGRGRGLRPPPPVPVRRDA